MGNSGDGQLVDGPGFCCVDYALTTRVLRAPCFLLASIGFCWFLMVSGGLVSFGFYWFLIDFGGF